MLLNRCGATPPDNGFGSPQHTHSKSASWDSHSDRLFLSLRFGQLLVGELFIFFLIFFNNSTQEFVFLPKHIPRYRIKLVKFFGNNRNIFDIVVGGVIWG